MRCASEHEDADWPTTLRYSRRLGESVRGAEYAMAIEGPRPRAGWVETVVRWVERLRAQASGQLLRTH